MHLSGLFKTGKRTSRVPKRLLLALSLFGVAALAIVGITPRVLADTVSTDFEGFTVGDVNGQNGWTSGHGSSFCPVYDVGLVTNTYGYPSLGTKSLRISNAITCGSFNDQTFSPSMPNEAGETSASTSVYSGGTRQPYFEAQWDFASTVPGSEQPGLYVVASADRGDPSRMSWLQMQDTPTGLQLNFEDYQESIQDFVNTPIATGLDRTVPHTVKMTIQFVDGPSNDIVKVYLDGALIHTGTTWEDYYRDLAPGGVPAPVDSIMFRVGGAAAPATLGNGFLIDNFSSFSGPVPVPPAPSNVYVNPLWTLIPPGQDPDGPGPASQMGYDAFSTISAALGAVATNGTVHIASGHYSEYFTITTNGVTLVGAGTGSGGTFIDAPSNLPAEGSIVTISANSVDMSKLTVEGPGPTGCGSLLNGIYVKNGSANLHDMDVLKIGDNVPSGCQNGIGIRVGRQADSATGIATINNVIVSDYQKGGIVVDNTGSSATITNSTVTGQGTITYIAQNGIQISRGATATISDGNTVTGNSYHNDANPSNWSATGVLLFQSGAVTMTGGDTISDNDLNVIKTGSSGSLSMTHESLGPSSAPASFGFIVFNDDPDAIIATSNWWGHALGPNSTQTSGNITVSPWCSVADCSATQASSSGTTTLLDQPANLSGSQSGNSATVPDTNDVVLSSSTSSATATISSGTTVTASGGTGTWDGSIDSPTITSASVPPVAGMTTTVTSAIEIGSTNFSLSFDSAVKLIFPGAHGQLVGFVSNGGTFTPITTVCNGNTQTDADNQLFPGGGACYINVGSDLVVWTTHFTKYVVYTQTATPPASSGSGSSTGSSTTTGSSKPASTSTTATSTTPTNSEVLGTNTNAGVIGSAFSTIAKTKVASAAAKTKNSTWEWLAVLVVVLLVAGGVFYIFKLTDTNSNR